MLRLSGAPLAWKLEVENLVVTLYKRQPQTRLVIVRVNLAWRSDGSGVILTSRELERAIASVPTSGLGLEPAFPGQTETFLNPAGEVPDLAGAVKALKEQMEPAVGADADPAIGQPWALHIVPARDPDGRIVTTKATFTRFVSPYCSDKERMPERVTLSFAGRHGGFLIRDRKVFPQTTLYLRRTLAPETGYVADLGLSGKELEAQSMAFWCHLGRYYGMGRVRHPPEYRSVAGRETVRLSLILALQADGSRNLNSQMAPPSLPDKILWDPPADLTPGPPQDRPASPQPHTNRDEVIRLSPPASSHPAAQP